MKFNMRKQHFTFLKVETVLMCPLFILQKITVNNKYLPAPMFYCDNNKIKIANYCEHKDTRCVNQTAAVDMRFIK